MGDVRLFLALLVTVAHLNVFVFPDVVGAERTIFGFTGQHAVMTFVAVGGDINSRRIASDLNLWP
jgi:hypothetical protein